MLGELITNVQHIVVAYGAFGVFLASIIEEVIAPIPSSVVVIGSSYFLMKDPTVSLISVEKLFFLIALPASIGVTIGSLFAYFITYYAGKPFIDKWGKYLGLSWDEIEIAEERFANTYKDELLLFFLRFIPITPSVVVNAFCGFIRYDIKKYILITFFGTLGRVFMLGFIGWQFGNFYQSISTQISYTENIAAVCILIAIIGFILYRIKRKS
jgi:membrane protein DedA with SNARE-associated domain